MRKRGAKKRIDGEVFFASSFLLSSVFLSSLLFPCGPWERKCGERERCSTLTPLCVLLLKKLRKGRGHARERERERDTGKVQWEESKRKGKPKQK